MSEAGSPQRLRRLRRQSLERLLFVRALSEPLN